MREFQKGDIVAVRNDRSGLAAKPGTLAIVTKIGPWHLILHWLGSANDQSDGSYGPADFRFATEDEVKLASAHLKDEAARVSMWKPPTPPPAPLKVGNRVRPTLESSYRGQIRYIDPVLNSAVVKWDDLNKLSVWSLDSLKLEKGRDC